MLWPVRSYVSGVHVEQGVGAMETPSIEKIRRERILLYLRPELIRQLKRHRGETDKPVGHIVEEALERHFDPAPAPSQ